MKKTETLCDICGEDVGCAKEKKKCATLEQQIKLLVLDQMMAEKRGYELAREIVMEQWDTDLRSYDEACKERDGGIKNDNPK